MQEITVRESIRLAVDTFGSDRDPLVLLIPGAGAPAEFWHEELCRDLAAGGHYVVRYSHRDTGVSTHFDEPYPIDELLHDLEALLAALANPEVHLVGHSMGGFLAQMAMCRPDAEYASVTSVSAGSTVTPEVAETLGMTSVSEATWQVLMENQPRGDFDDDLPGWLQSWRFLNGARPFDEALAIRYTRSLYVGDPRNAQVATHHIHAMTTVPSSLASDLTTARCPLLVIHGSDDPLVSLDHGEATARLVPNSTLVRLEGAGHMFFHEETWREIGRALASHTHSRIHRAGP